MRYTTHPAIVFLVLVVLGVVFSIDVFVKPNGADIEGCGVYNGNISNAAPPCETISYAIRKCNETTDCNIFLFPGTYKYENNTNILPPPRFKLVGIEGKDNTVIDYKFSNSTEILFGMNIMEADRMEISGITFANFAAQSAMGTLVIVQEARENSSLTVSDCEFNSGPGTFFGEFVSIFSLQDAFRLNTTFENCVFQDNSCVIAKGTGVFVVVKSSFKYNNKTLFDLLGGHLLIEDSEFIGNQERSALITLDGFSTLTVTNSSFIESNAQSIVFIGLVPSPALRSYFFFYDVTFEGNIGVYALNGNGANGTIARCSFTQNRLSPVYLINSDLILLGSTFYNNSNSYSQVINYVDNDGISLKGIYILFIHNCSFIENEAESSGGAVRVSADSSVDTLLNVTISNSNFCGNYAERLGGAILVNGNTNVTLNFVTLEYNSASSKGGAVYCTSTTGQGRIDFQNVTLKYNYAGNDDDDQVYNDPNAPCELVCSEGNTIICSTYYDFLPSYALVLGSLAIMVTINTSAMMWLHWFCYKASKKSISRFGYTNLHR